ncbi:MAG TPA: ATP-grasp domain-containing protein [Thermohalobaculum sp.]|nr:ATP-grasp domain-containing protein [Thermohalobaculum sp.]
MSAIHVLHEDDARAEAIFAALERRGLPVERWHLAGGTVDPEATPPEGVFYNRMSASSHIRGHRFAPELAAQVLGWIEAHGRRVVNGSGALRLEVDKLAQYRALAAAGVRTPRTIGAVGREAVLRAGEAMGAPFILKPNRGGSGAGIRLIESRDQLAAALDDPETAAPLDGTWLVQEYVRGAEPAITRAEFVGGRFCYALRVDTSQGFELCPSDACAVPGGRPLFEVIEGFHDPILERYEEVLAANGIGVAGVEFIRDGDGRIFTYDINTNTNYNSEAEGKAGVSGLDRLADFLGRELELERERRAAA